MLRRSDLSTSWRQQKDRQRQQLVCLLPLRAWGQSCRVAPPESEGQPAPTHGPAARAAAVAGCGPAKTALPTCGRAEETVLAPRHTHVGAAPHHEGGHLGLQRDLRHHQGRASSPTGLYA